MNNRALGELLQKLSKAIKAEDFYSIRSLCTETAALFVHRSEWSEEELSETRCILNEAQFVASELFGSLLYSLGQAATGRRARKAYTER